MLKQNLNDKTVKPQSKLQFLREIKSLDNLSKVIVKENLETEFISFLQACVGNKQIDEDLTESCLSILPSAKRDFTFAYFILAISKFNVELLARVLTELKSAKERVFTYSNVETQILNSATNYLKKESKNENVISLFLNVLRVEKVEVELQESHKEFDVFKSVEELIEYLISEDESKLTRFLFLFFLPYKYSGIFNLTALGEVLNSILSKPKEVNQSFIYLIISAVGKSTLPSRLLLIEYLYSFFLNENFREYILFSDKSKRYTIKDAFFNCFGKNAYISSLLVEVPKQIIFQRPYINLKIEPSFSINQQSSSSNDKLNKGFIKRIIQLYQTQKLSFNGFVDYAFNQSFQAISTIIELMLEFELYLEAAFFVMRILKYKDTLRPHSHKLILDYLASNFLKTLVIGKSSSGIREFYKHFENLPQLNMMVVDEFKAATEGCLNLDKKVEVIFIDSLIKFTKYIKSIAEDDKRHGIDLEFHTDLFWSSNQSSAATMQISGAKNVFIYDMLKLGNIPEFFNLFTQAYSNKLFIAFGFHEDMRVMNANFKEFFTYKVKVFDLNKYFQTKYETNFQIGLSRMCKEFIGSPLCKLNQCSNWGKRPLSNSQMHYAALDAFVLLELHDLVQKEIIPELYEQVKPQLKVVREKWSKHKDKGNQLELLNEIHIEDQLKEFTRKMKTLTDYVNFELSEQKGIKKYELREIKITDLIKRGLIITDLLYKTTHPLVGVNRHLITFEKYPLFHDIEKGDQVGIYYFENSIHYIE